jgi:acetyl esterase/lipase
VVVIRPQEERHRGAVVWVHGGGMVLGSGTDDTRGLQELADELAAIVVSVDYRLAPEHPYPTPLEDCYAALCWTAELPEVQGLPIVLAGGSAGGGLAAGTALAARDRGGPDLAAQVLIYPMLDDRTASRVDDGHAHRRLWDVRSNAFGWRCYLGQEPGAAEVPAYAAPARAIDLSGLPATWMGVGTLDLFHDEDLDYAARLEAAGVPCRVEVVEGAFHGFDLAKRTAVARAFRASYVAAIDSALRG